MPGQAQDLTLHTGTAASAYVNQGGCGVTISAAHR